jgi:hypothetical protein
MAQRDVEHVIGRLVTDEDFRREFLGDPAGTLQGLIERGVGLNRAELAAIVATPRTVWTELAESLDPRLQKASLKS